METPPSNLVEQAIQDLPNYEFKAYKAHKLANGKPLSPTLGMQLFQLYITGHSCRDIQKLNPQFTLGMIVECKVEGLWDEKRRELAAELVKAARDTAIKAQADSIQFVGDLLTASHKLIGEKVQRYIQTGDEDHVKDVGIHSLKQYKDLVELLLKLTGQDGKREVKVKGDGIGGPVTAAPVTAVDAEVVDDKLPPANATFPGPLSPSEASKALAILAADLNDDTDEDSE